MGPAGGEGVGDIKGFCIQHSVPPTLLHLKLAKGPDYFCHRTWTPDRPHSIPTHTLTLALELADNGVQVSVLRRDVAPADWHLPAAASARSHQRSGSWRLRPSSGSAASGSGWAPPPGRAAGLHAPPACLRIQSSALPSPPEPSLRRPLAAPSFFGAGPGAVRTAVLKEVAGWRRGRVRGAGATSPGLDGAEAGP